MAISDAIILAVGPQKGILKIQAAMEELVPAVLLGCVIVAAIVFCTWFQCFRKSSGEEGVARIAKMERNVEMEDKVSPVSDYVHSLY